MTTETPTGDALVPPPLADSAVAETASAASPPVEPGPRIRWAGIAWGALFAAFAAIVLAVVVDPAQRALVRGWLLAFDPQTVDGGAVVGYVAIAVGVVLLITGGLALLRRAERRDPA